MFLQAVNVNVRLFVVLGIGWAHSWRSRRESFPSVALEEMEPSGSLLLHKCSLFHRERQA